MSSNTMSERLRVWAPRASRVEVLVDGTRVAAERDGEWWTGPTLEPYDEYAISLDGGPPRPDPRSRWQPEGVNGRSVWIDPSGLGLAHRPPFRALPLRDAIIYELHIGTFSRGGTFDFAIAHLDHLVWLGVTHVELMPVAQFPGTHGWGYDGVDLFAVHQPYGGPRSLRELIDQCHEHKLAVVIDVVHNHLGPEGAYLAEFAPYTTSRHATPWGQAINLSDPNVRRFLIDSALMWLRDYGIDGLRLDALHSLHDDSDRHFVAELVDEVRALERELERPLVLIGEYDDHDPRVVTERSAGGWGLDAHWNDDFHHAVHALLANEASGYYADFAAPGTLAKVIERGYALDGVVSQHRGGPHGHPFGSLPRDRLVAYVQSHDQIGNRPGGERLHQLAGLDRAKLAAALLLASPFVPMLFQGEEWAASSPFHFFAQFESEDIRNAVREGRRAEHAAAGWPSTPDPIDPATRDMCVLRWEERTEPPHAEMLAWYHELIAARRSYPALRSSSEGATHVVQRDTLLRIERGELVLVCNFASIPAHGALDDGHVVLASSGLSSSRELPPLSCALVRR
jgi:maltooligosyltrehalose trehalohydrolase